MYVGNYSINVKVFGKSDRLIGINFYPVKTASAKNEKMYLCGIVVAEIVLRQFIFSNNLHYKFKL